MILSVLHFTGCSSLAVISKDDVAKGRAAINFNDELYLTTKDFTRYHFLPHNYQITKDTLHGRGMIVSSAPEISFKGSIALNDVINFEQNELDIAATLGLIGGIIAVGVIIFAVIIGEALGHFFSLLK